MDLSAWAHVTECSLEVPSGRLIVGRHRRTALLIARVGVLRPQAPTEFAPSALASITLRDNDLDGDDHYYFAAWPAPSFAEWHVRKPATLRRLTNKD